MFISGQNTVLYIYIYYQVVENLGKRGEMVIIPITPEEKYVHHAYSTSLL